MSLFISCVTVNTSRLSWIISTEFNLHAIVLIYVLEKHIFKLWQKCGDCIIHNFSCHTHVGPFGGYMPLLHSSVYWNINTSHLAHIYSNLMLCQLFRITFLFPTALIRSVLSYKKAKWRVKTILKSCCYCNLQWNKSEVDMKIIFPLTNMFLSRLTTTLDGDLPVVHTAHTST